MTTEFLAPDIATIAEYVRETYPTLDGDDAKAKRARATRGAAIYRWCAAGTFPHLRVGEKSIRILMPAARKYQRGEPVAPELLEGRPVTTRAAEEA